LVHLSCLTYPGFIPVQCTFIYRREASQTWQEKETEQNTDMQFSTLLFLPRPSFPCCKPRILNYVPIESFHGNGFRDEHNLLQISGRISLISRRNVFSRSSRVILRQAANKKGRTTLRFLGFLFESEDEGCTIFRNVSELLHD
jgi:hypothetical protein